MHAPKYVLTSYQKKLQEMDYEKHKKRLEGIQKPSAKQAVKEKDKAWRSTFGEFRAKHIKFHINERIAEIDKDNQTLLNKLVKISRSQKPPLFDNTTMTNWTNPKTLNTYYRKRELEKIALENESFAKRLISQNGSISVKRLDDDFTHHLGYKKQVQKVTLTSPKTVTTSPMKSPSTGDNNKTRAFKIKKKRKTKKIKTEMNQTIDPLHQSKVIIEPDYRTMATEGPEDGQGGDTARQIYHTLPEHRSEVENLTQEHEGAASQKELVGSRALNSVNRLEAGEAETKSHENLQPTKPAESQESNANSLRSSRTLKAKRSDTVHLTSSEVIPERGAKRKSFTNIIGMGERKNSNPVVGSGGLVAFPKSQYANSTRTQRKSESEIKGKSETGRSLAKSQALENNQEGGGASHNSQENIEGSNNSSQKNLESPDVQENETSEKS